MCELLAHDADPTAPTSRAILNQVSRESRLRKELLTYAICFKKSALADDRENLQIGIQLSHLTKDRPVQTLIYQSTELRHFFRPKLAGP